MGKHACGFCHSCTRGLVCANPSIRRKLDSKAREFNIHAFVRAIGEELKNVNPDIHYTNVAEFLGAY